MSLKFTCDDKATLVAYLYNEIEVADRQRVEEHLRECAACESEVGALAAVRTELTQWAPPNAELGFTIVRNNSVRKDVEEPAAALAAETSPNRPGQGWSSVPVWAQALAAVLVLAVSAGVANVQVKSGPDGLVVSTGWMAPASVPASPAQGAAPDAGSEQWRTALTALETQLREEIRANQPAGVVRAASRSEVDEATIRRVQDMLAASESRQNRELALRVTQLTRDMNIQRRSDLLRVEQAIGHTSVEMAKQRQTVNYLIRASTTPQQ
ncbi:MAG: anti-sigma factor [Vicinamibacterales bacterium]